ncbi:MAG: YhdH/YhfP family quinone oxidoreductase [Pseudomonadales bacterium]|nr:YhdH/YhfP family quinone oxidoreductase [Pseudomonadales bacterium]
MSSFKALVTREVRDGLFDSQVETRELDSLPEGELLIRVHYSSLNYKDALSASGNRGVTRKFPHTPGIDAVGIVEESSHPDFKPGDNVLVTGYDLGMGTSGGFAEFIQVPFSWAVKLPPALSMRQAMILGTAGLTAALCVEKLRRMDVTPDKGEILVTGATGGVGSICVTILNKLGYRVLASSGKIDQASFLSDLGASMIIDRETLAEQSSRAMNKEQWAGAIDTVGGETLSNVLKSIQYGGAVACCGLVSSPEFSTSIMPFIIRGVSLMGVDSVELPIATKQGIWDKIATDLNDLPLERLATEIRMDDLPAYIERILAGKMVGRVVVSIADSH